MKILSGLFVGLWLLIGACPKQTINAGDKLNSWIVAHTTEAHNK